MKSLAEVTATESAVLIDCASSVIQVAILEPSGEARWAKSTEEAGLGLFSCLEDLSIEPPRAASWIFCTGPGSILGIRTAAMALRTWGVLRSAPIYGYLSLTLVAHAQSGEEVPVIADARRDSWHVFTRTAGLRRVPAAEMTGPFITPAGFRHWSPLPAGTTEVSYDLRELLPRVWQSPLLSPCPEPDAFLHEQPSYVTWTPAIHRAPAT